MRFPTARVIAFAASMLAATQAIAWSDGLTGYSGHPSDGDTCSYCHYDGGGDCTTPTGNFTNYSGSISANSSILRGSSQSITYSMTRSGGTAIGLGGMGARINTGSFSGGASVTISNASGNNTATHNLSSNTPSGGNISWSWSWTAPSGFGNHTLYVCGNPTNNDANCTGDGPHTNTCRSHTFSVVNSRPNSVNDGSTGAPFLTVSEDATSYQNLPSVLANDGDLDGGDTLSVNGGPNGASGDASRIGNTFRYRPGVGNFDYLPAYNPGDPSTYFTDTFTYTITDSTGQSNQTSFADTIYVRVTGVDDPPTAANDGSVGTGFLTVIEGMSVSSGPASVLTNDSDPDHAETAVRNATCGTGLGPTYGTVALNSNGTFTYTHNGNDVATQDTFRYCAVGGSVYSSPATVYIDITLQNDPPVSNNFGVTSGITFAEQTPVNIATGGSLSFTDNDSTLLNQVIVDITGNYAAGQDSLACTSLPGGINCGSFNAGTGQIILSGGSSGGAASLADYETAVEGVQFVNSSDNPDQNQRAITIILRDDANQSSVAAVRTYSNPITRSNDPPTLAAIANQIAFEDTVADPYTFTYTAVASDPDVNDDTNTGNGSLSYSLSGAPAGMSISNAPGNPGEISWNPPQTGTFNRVYGPISVFIEDGNEDASPPNSRSFNISVSPPDGDTDQVANYDDLCVSVASVNPGENFDNDNDGTPGTNGTPGSLATTGGDVCDDDDDNDQILDVDELSYSLDPFDPTDATEDNDGDGINNRDEINNGTNPNSVNLTIDATGYLTPYELPQQDPKDFHLEATQLTASDYGPYRPGDNTIYWTPSNSLYSDLAADRPGLLVSDPPEQIFLVRPLLNFAADQIAAEGATVTVTLSLNGDAPVYPVTVYYSVSGSASTADYTTPAPASGAVTFNDTTPQTIAFDLTAGDGADAGETIVFSITSASNAAIGAGNSHTVTIIEDNVAPQGRLRFSQGGNAYSSLPAGIVDIDVDVSDVNVSPVVPGVTHTYDWSATDNALVAPVGGNSWTTPALAPGNYFVDVLVTDNGSPRQSVRVRRILNVVAAGPALLNTDDTDGDTIDDLTEGFDDSDGDGIPDYLDALDGSAGAAHMLDDQTVAIGSRYWLETEPGLSLRTGSTSQAAGSFGALITDTEIENFGSPNGAASRFPEDDFEHFGGVYDFTVSGLAPGSSALVVIPLQVSIPRDAEFRKYDPASGWGVFVENASNRLFSAQGDLGACPEPGSDLYQPGLNYLDNCLQLLVEDGGPNDSDNAVNGEVADPGTLGAKFTEPVLFEEVEDGGGQMSLLLMTLLALTGFVPAIRRRLARRG